MIDETQEELAALYAFDLLEGAELTRFQADLARDRDLQELVRELGKSTTSLAHLPPAAPPPPELKVRVLASIAAASSKVTASDNVIRPAPSAFRLLAPWAVAACLALTSAWVGRLYIASRSENALRRQQNELADIAVKSARQQVEAERIVGRRRIEDLTQQIAVATGELDNSRAQLAGTTRQLAAADSRAAAQDRQIAEQSRRIYFLAGASAEIGRQLGQAKDLVVMLTDEVKSQNALANLKITTLASMLKNSPEARAIALWDPAKQEGQLRVARLPALGANEDYQLWVVDPQYPNPVDGGVVTVDPQTGEARISFKAKQPVQAINAFAVTRERKGGVPKAEGPFVLLGK